MCPENVNISFVVCLLKDSRLFLLSGRFCCCPTLVDFSDEEFVGQSFRYLASSFDWRHWVDSNSVEIKSVQMRLWAASECSKAVLGRGLGAYLLVEYVIPAPVWAWAWRSGVREDQCNSPGWLQDYNCSWALGYKGAMDRFWDTLPAGSHSWSSGWAWVEIWGSSRCIELILAHFKPNSDKCFEDFLAELLVFKSFKLPLGTCLLCYSPNPLATLVILTQSLSERFFKILINSGLFRQIIIQIQIPFYATGHKPHFFSSISALLQIFCFSIHGVKFRNIHYPQISQSITDKLKLYTLKELNVLFGMCIYYKIKSS